MSKFKYIVVALLLSACTSDDTDTLIENSNTLTNYLQDRSVENGAVIACAGNTEDDTVSVEIFFYPEEDATNYRLYETSSTDVDSNDFLNYNRIFLNDAPVFNGYLRKFTGEFTTERWFIVSFEKDNEIKLSNPIRLKNESQPTLFANAISINQQLSQMPLFNWNVNSEMNNAIFFQVLSTINNDLISGTYTYENQFQYYDTSNVILNITNGTPPDLVLGDDYKMTIMDVSVDNWINEIFVSQFTVE
ncbi:hypothetical protein HNV10_00775 [Winogradskyella litoriviva]|uniref:Uncharacterized protein n=1 Tax=Winogradskyella litoriviva TaxID=1220182 RepID=A0ABX2DZM2_9FLAO|nr:hypothetical protein [Winogradskyella litoriviva]NRD21753.1 hypothetical protein [Winogradskyella litoriviva]